MNETQLPEAVHEKADSRTSRAHHLGQGLLTDFRDYSLGHAFLAKVSQHKQDPGQSLFAGIEQLVNQVLLVADIARQQVRDKQVGKGVLPMKRNHHGLLVDAEKLAFAHGSRRSHADRLPCQGALTEEISRIQDSDRSFLADLGHDGQPDLTFLDIEDGVRRIPLGEDPLFLGSSQTLPALANGCEEGYRIEFAVLLTAGNWTHQSPF